MDPLAQEKPKRSPREAQEKPKSWSNRERVRPTHLVKGVTLSFDLPGLAYSRLFDGPLELFSQDGLGGKNGQILSDVDPGAAQFEELDLLLLLAGARCPLLFFNTYSVPTDIDEVARILVGILLD